MLSSQGRFVVKPPKARVDGLVDSGAGERFEASPGRPMKEWLQFDSQSTEDWRAKHSSSLGPDGDGATGRLRGPPLVPGFDKNPGRSG